MSDSLAIQIHKACIDILQFLEQGYNNTYDRSPREYYPDHVTAFINELEYTTLSNPTAVLYLVIYHDIFLTDVVLILERYPRAYRAMCRYSGDNATINDTLSRYQ